MNIKDKCLNCWLSREQDRQGFGSGSGSVILVEGPQGSGKSTLTQSLATSLGCDYRRGFPTGQEIAAANGLQTLICRGAYNRVSDSVYKPAVFDRSPISQVAFLLRSTGDQSYLRCLDEILSSLSENRSVLTIFIDAPANVCVRRQSNNGNGALSIVDIETMQSEINIYHQLSSHLRQINLPNLNYLTVTNSGDTSINEVTQLIINQINTGNVIQTRNSG